MRTDHMNETICLVRKEIAKKAERKRLSFWQFLRTQVRFIGWKIWMLQLVVLGVVYACMTGFFEKYYTEHPEDLPRLLMVLAVIVLMTAIPFLYRSIRYRMQEIESVTYVSSVRLMMARLFIIAVGDCIILASMYIMVISNAIIPKMLLFLCLSIPFFAACNGCLYMVGHSKPEHFLHGSIGLCMAMIGLFLYKGAWLELLFQNGIYGLLLCVLLMMLCIYQIWNMQESSYTELQIS